MNWTHVGKGIFRDKELDLVRCMPISQRLEPLGSPCSESALYQGAQWAALVSALSPHIRAAPLSSSPALRMVYMRARISVPLD